MELTHGGGGVERCTARRRARARGNSGKELAIAPPAAIVTPGSGRRGRARASNKSRRSVLSRGLARSYPETREGRGQRPVLGGGDGQGSEGGPRGYCVEMPARSIRDLTPHVERATCERSKTGKLLASPTKNGKTGIETHLVCLDPACSVDHLADERSPAYFWPRLIT
jgi:hypothetical protein